MHTSEKPNQTGDLRQDPFSTLLRLLRRDLDPHQVEDEDWPDILVQSRRHHLLGPLSQSLREMGASLPETWEREMVFQRWVNTWLFESLEEMEDDLGDRGVRVIRLKGASTAPRLYADSGDRHLSDMDVLVRPHEAKVVTTWLEAKGYVHQPVLEWEGTRNRMAFARVHRSGLEVSLDVHTGLYWRQPPGLSERVVYDQAGFWRLCDEVELLHLIVNWIEQDTCVSFNKAYDIQLLVRHLHDRINWNEWWQWARDLGHGRSVRLAAFVLSSCFGVRIPMLANSQGTWSEALLSPGFLAAPQAHRLRYLTLKHCTRPLTRALAYDWGWFSARVKSRLAKRLRGLGLIRDGLECFSKEIDH
ncbi:MAG: nucleotidyltransferase family protein [Bdellovibrionales bacterium]